MAEESLKIGRLLVVEDDESLAKYIAEQLEDYFDVIVRHDGQAGLDAAIEFRPHLVISDVRMPRLSGLNMLKRIRRTPGLETVAVILLSVLKSDEDRIRGYDTLADLYFTKPFNIHELISASVGLVRIRQKFRAGIELEEPVDPLGEGLTDDDRRLLHRISTTVEARLSDTDLTVDDLASEVHVSRRQLERKLKDLEGITPLEYIRQIRLELAKQRLDSGVVSSIKSLAYEVGFKDVRTFSSRFKEQFGYSPST